ncbi:hypothetical protein F4820DRAFT_418966 [Hypoxylon rubiginosum]|uniref:Uncharacterized protein n=1 Tax=Hypoxylon rubiginosum TaxID=110542 RepID=A0ACB9Z358_9PEZI|nr:hypothetical protein F4820DRAFT_418966 [Hypoxylon rubiginosum]
MQGKLLTIGIGVCLVYGASQKALGYRTVIPPDVTGSPADIKTDQISTASKIEFAYVLVLPLTLGCTKASFLCFYKRIFSVKQPTNILLITLIVFIALWSAGFFFTTLFQCGSNIWATWGTEQELLTHCLSSWPLALSFSVTDLITDVVIISIPVPLIWQLKLSTGKKLGASLVFALVIVTIIASAIRLTVTAKAKHAPKDFDPGHDKILTITEQLYWGMVECSTGVLAACLPDLRYLLRGCSWKYVVGTFKRIFGLSRPAVQPSGSSDQIIRVGHTVEVTYAKRSSTSTRSSSTAQVQNGGNMNTLPPVEVYPMREWRIVGSV